MRLYNKDGNKMKIGKNKRRLLVFAVLTVLYFAFVSCVPDADVSGTGNESVIGATSGSWDEISVPVPTLSDGDVNVPDALVQGNYSSSGESVAITLNGTSVSCEGNVATDGCDIKITAAGTYVLTGALDDGSITVNAGDEDKVELVLNGVSISSFDSPAITVLNADKTVIRLADGSVNMLSDGSVYSSVQADGEPDACVYSKDDLTVKGTGTLYVTGNCAKGIHSKDDLKIEEATLYVNSTDDGIRGKDSMCIYSGSKVVVVSGGDGIRTNNDTDEGKGYIIVEGGSIEVNAKQDAIQALTDIDISGGTFVLTAGEGASSGDSCKGIKAGGNMTITDGAFLINSGDDALHSDGEITVNGGAFTIIAGDDGIHADTVLTVAGGKIDISDSYEGIESIKINIAGGTVNIVASDDGMNAADGSSSGGAGGFGGGGFGGGFGGGGFGGRGDRGGFGEADENCVITITGGTITINAAGDGVDSNGNITMSGGSLTVFGPTNNGNGALDYGGTFTVSGGSVYAFGSSGMAQGVTASGTQKSIMVRLNGGADSTLRVVNGDGTAVCEITTPKAYSCVVISTPETVGGDYTFYLNGEELGTLEI